MASDPRNFLHQADGTPDACKSLSFLSAFNDSLPPFNDSANAIDITKIVKCNIGKAFGYEARETESDYQLASQTGKTTQYLAQIWRIGSTRVPRPGLIRRMT